MYFLIYHYFFIVLSIWILNYKGIEEKKILKIESFPAIGWLGFCIYIL